MENFKKEKYIYVKFPDNNYKYIYKTDLDCKVGNVVEAPTCNYAASNDAIVTEVVELADNELPVSKGSILNVTKIIAEKDDKVRPIKYDWYNWNDDYRAKEAANEEFIKKFPKTYVAEWDFDYKTDWVKVWKSSYGYSVSYENDGTLEVFYFNPETEECFDEYTTTPSKNLGIKIAYVETITSEWYHKIIDKKTFKELFLKIS